MWTGPNTPLALADTVEESSSGELGGVSLMGFYSNATGDRGRRLTTMPCCWWPAC